MAVALVFVGYVTTNWLDDVDIVGGRFDGTVCAWSVYDAMTAGPIYGTSEGGDPEARKPAFEAACTEAARPAWEAGLTQMRIALTSVAAAIALSLGAAIAWFRARPHETFGHRCGG